MSSPSTASGTARSDRPHDPGLYEEHLLVADLVAVLDAERVDRAAVWGFSLGAIETYVLPGADHFATLARSADVLAFVGPVLERWRLGNPAA